MNGSGGWIQVPVAHAWQGARECGGVVASRQDHTPLRGQSTYAGSRTITRWIRKKERTHIGEHKYSRLAWRVVVPPPTYLMRSVLVHRLLTHRPTRDGPPISAVWISILSPLENTSVSL